MAFESAVQKKFLLRDRNGNYGVLTVSGLPTRVLEQVDAAKCLATGKVLKQKYSIDWPESLDGVQRIHLVKHGMFAVGARGDNFEAVGGAVITAGCGNRGNQYKKLN